MEYNYHFPVLFHESIQMLNIKPNGIYVDGTAGRGNHSKAIYEKLDENGLLICIDQDIEAINYIKQIFKNKSNVIIVHDNFENLRQILKNLKIEKIDGLLLDLGVSSPQLDNPERGFSYQHDGPLDMRMNLEQKLNANIIINEWPKNYLINIFKKYGEIYNSQAVVNAILNQRKIHKIETTLELVELIKKNIPQKELFISKHPARKYFQAIRIAVNHEFEALENLLESFDSILNINGTVVIITFHSLEDNLVLHHFRNLCRDEIIPGFNHFKNDAKFCLINKKPIVATEEELNKNNRSRSAKLRGIRKIKN